MSIDLYSVASKTLGETVYLSLLWEEDSDPFTLRQPHPWYLYDKFLEVMSVIKQRPGDRNRVVIFTESLITQDYVRSLLIQRGGYSAEEISNLIRHRAEAIENDEQRPNDPELASLGR